MTSQQNELPSELVCPSCLAPISANDHFCAKCNVPLTAFAATDPIASIRATGYVYASAVNRPRSRIVFIGFWLLFGSLFLLNLAPLYVSCLMLRSHFVTFNNFSH